MKPHYINNYGHLMSNTRILYVILCFVSDPEHHSSSYNNDYAKKKKIAYNAKMLGNDVSRNNGKGKCILYAKSATFDVCACHCSYLNDNVRFMNIVIGLLTFIYISKECIL